MKFKKTVLHILNLRLYVIIIYDSMRIVKKNHYVRSCYTRVNIIIICVIKKKPLFFPAKYNSKCFQRENVYSTLRTYYFKQHIHDNIADGF